MIEGFLAHLDDFDGELALCEAGIGKGSSLSPLIGALYLDSLDRVLMARAETYGGFYIQFMDDWFFYDIPNGI